MYQPLSKAERELLTAPEDRIRIPDQGYSADSYLTIIYTKPVRGKICVR